MTEFRIGQRVRVIAGPRTGEEHRIASGIKHSRCWTPYSSACGTVDGEPYYELDTPPLSGEHPRSHYPARWLAPIDDDADRAVAAEMDSWLDRVVRKGRVEA